MRCARFLAFALVPPICPLIGVSRPRNGQVTISNNASAVSTLFGTIYFPSRNTSPDGAVTPRDAVGNKDRGEDGVVKPNGMEHAGTSDSPTPGSRFTPSDSETLASLPADIAQASALIKRQASTGLAAASSTTSLVSASARLASGLVYLTTETDIWNVTGPTTSMKTLTFTSSTSTSLSSVVTCHVTTPVTSTTTLISTTTVELTIAPSITTQTTLSTSTVNPSSTWTMLRTAPSPLSPKDYTNSYILNNPTSSDNTTITFCTQP